MQGNMIAVRVYDADVTGTLRSHDTIDTLLDVFDAPPDTGPNNAVWHAFEWGAKTDKTQ